MIPNAKTLAAEFRKWADELDPPLPRPREGFRCSRCGEWLSSRYAEATKCHYDGAAWTCAQPENRDWSQDGLRVIDGRTGNLL